ncbi:MAG TPA: hypothetical protein VGI73_07415 [Solirubrobacterales bacterium]|jgi:hypothetical protein
MVRDRGRSVLGWAARWGFAALVGLGVVAAICAAWTVDPPAEVPSFALQAETVYRLEVGTTVFVAIYLAAMALVLALNNKAFSEIGTSGVKAHGVGGEVQTEAIRRLQVNVKEVFRMVADLQENSERIDEKAATLNVDDNQ